METPNEGTQKRTNQVIIISMIPGIQNLNLPMAKEKNVEYKHLGIDQNENDIVELSYSFSQRDVIHSIKLYLKFFEGLVAGLKPLMEPALKVFNEELTKLGEIQNQVDIL